MYEVILKWVGLANLILLIPIFIRVPRAIRLATEADYLGKKAELLQTEIEMEKLRRTQPAESEAAKEQLPTQ